MTVRIGTRASNLAMWQATAVHEALVQHGIEAELVPLSSTGDRSLGGQLSASVGQFVHAIDDHLLAGEVDIAVHSSKDVPVDVDERIEHLAYLERGCTTDLIIVRKTGDAPSLDDVLEPPEVAIDIKHRPSSFGLRGIASRKDARDILEHIVRRDLVVAMVINQPLLHDVDLGLSVRIDRL